MLLIRWIAMSRCTRDLQFRFWFRLKLQQITCSCVYIWRSIPSSSTSSTAPSSTESVRWHEFLRICFQLTPLSMPEITSPFWAQYSQKQQDYPTILKRNNFVKKYVSHVGDAFSENKEVFHCCMTWFDWSMNTKLSQGGGVKQIGMEWIISLDLRNTTGKDLSEM